MLLFAAEATLVVAPLAFAVLTRAGAASLGLQRWSAHHPITSNNQTGQQGQQYDQNPGGYQPDVLPPVSYYETYNIYDPLAAVMLAQQKRLSTAQRVEAVMNG